MDMNVHGATKLRISKHYASNANSITIEISSRDGIDEITLYGLPKSTTNKLLLALADDETKDYDAPDEAEEAAREEYTERQIIDAGRGHLVGR